MSRQVATNALMALGSLVIASAAMNAKAAGTAAPAHRDPRQPPKVIYGDDDRREVYDSSNDPLMVKCARSTAALMKKTDLKADDKDPTKMLTTKSTFGDFANLCPSEPFRNQPSAAFCSGFLVAPDTLVTAGHCVTNQDDCDSIAVVFDFAYDTPDQDPTVVSRNNLYSCKRIFGRKLSGDTDSDFAVIQLDRPVVGRTPLKFRTEGKIEPSEHLTLIGHPAGIPTKIAGGAIVRNNDSQPFFVSDTDSYGGNSGSAVLDTVNGIVEGVLVRGEQDFEEKNGCYVSKHCAIDGCRGEDVTRATEFAAYVPDASDQTDTRPTNQHVYAFDKLNLAIPDDDAQHPLVYKMHVTDKGTVAGVGIHIKITHPYTGDLSISLVHPDGTRVLLYDHDGGSTQNLDRVFGLGGDAVMPLRLFKNKEAAGDWQLVVTDTAAGDKGTLNAVDFTVKTYVAPAQTPASP